MMSSSIRLTDILGFKINVDTKSLVTQKFFEICKIWTKTCPNKVIFAENMLQIAPASGYYFQLWYCLVLRF